MIDYEIAQGTPEFRARWRGLAQFHGAGKTLIPNKPQALFAKAVGELVPQDYRVFLATSANGIGKTTIVINILLNIIYPGYNIYTYARDCQTGETFPGFFNYPLYKEWPKSWPKKVWFISNADSLRFIHEELKIWAPPHSYHEREWVEGKDGKTYVSRVDFPEKGWVIYYKTVDQEPGTFETANISVIIFDEPPPRNLYKAAVYRIRSGGFILIPATPLFSAGWFVDDILEKVQEGSHYHYHQTVEVWENCIETAGEWDLGEYGIQKKGNLEKRIIDFQIQETDPDEVEARVYGRFQHLVGLIFKSYKRELIFRELPARIQPREYMYRFVLDPHDRKPPAASWYALDWHNRITKIREFPGIHDEAFHGKRFVDIKDSGSYTVRDFCRMFLEIEQELQIPPWRVQDIIDPNFGNKKNSVSGLMIFEEYEKAMREVAKEMHSERHYRFILNVVDDLAIGHKTIKGMLKPLNTGDMPYLIDPNCINTDLAYRRYKYKDQTDKQDEEMGLSEKIEHKWKDFIDNDRYCFMIPWKWKPGPDKLLKESTDYEPPKRRWDAAIRATRPEGAEGA